MQVIRFSVVAACYNSAPYIDDFLDSLFNQSIGYKSLEIILVDDGSTDATAAKIADWSKRYPGSIKYKYQRNAGQATARNKGLRLVTGDWVAFMDPDDFVSENYLEEASKEIARTGRQGLCLISCNFIYFFEDQRILSDSHFLNFRFKANRTECKVKDIDDKIQLATNSCWISLRSIRSSKAKFDPRIRPSFEDAAFCNRLLLSNLNKRIVYLKAPKYYYRKRRSKDSSIDKAAVDPEYYTSELHYGHLKLLQHCKAKLGYVPRFIQNTVLYTLAFRIHIILSSPSSLAFLGSNNTLLFERTLRSIFKFLEPSTITNFKLADFSVKDQIGVLGIFKNTSIASTSVKLESVNMAAGALQFSHDSYSPDRKVLAVCNGREAETLHSSRVEQRFLKHAYCYRHYFWIRVNGNAAISFRLNDAWLNIDVHGKRCPPIVTARQLHRAFRPNFRVGFQGLGDDDRSLRRHVTSAAVAQKFGDCWLFVDRKQFAGDNAEHLYRYVQSKGTTIKIFFALARNSTDWLRLKQEGFKLIDANSREYLAALANCRLFISSHLYRTPKAIGDLCHFEYIFLQHGVTIHDQSQWFSSYRLSRLIATTFAEHESFTGISDNYRFSEREVVLTGMPRHDTLLALRKRSNGILVMPTWRKALQNASDDSFRNSQFFKRWFSLLTSKALTKLSRRNGLKIRLILHPEFMRYGKLFKSASFEVLETRFLAQEFARSSILITDFSSVAFDVAYLNKPVIYYQFDAAEVYSSTHIYGKGYFDYRRHGFGPVARTEKLLLQHLKTTLSGKEDPVYKRRRLETFPFKDGKCCERVYQSILEL